MKQATLSRIRNNRKIRLYGTDHEKKQLEITNIINMLRKGYKNLNIYGHACVSAYMEGVSVDVINWLEENYAEVEVGDEERINNLFLGVK